MLKSPFLEMKIDYIALRGAERLTSDGFFWFGDLAASLGTTTGQWQGGTTGTHRENCPGGEETGDLLL
jgi:hypothetical protein